MQVQAGQTGIFQAERSDVWTIFNCQTAAGIIAERIAVLG